MIALALALAATVAQAHPDDRLVATVPEGYEPTAPPLLPNGAAKEIGLPFAFSPAGDRVAYFTHRKNRTYFVLGDEVGNWGDLHRGPIFSGDGEHVAHAIGRTARNRTTAWEVFVDDSRVSKEDWVGPLSLSADGDAVAYWSKPKYKPDKNGFDNDPDAELVLARRKSKKKFSVTRGDAYPMAAASEAPALDREGRHAIGCANVAGEPAVLAVGGRKPKVLCSDQLGYYDVAVSAEKKRVAVVQWDYENDPDDAEWRAFVIVVDGRVLEVEGDAVGLPAFSPNGEHLAFVYHEGGQFGVGVGDSLIAPGADPITRVEACDDGATLAWVVHEGGAIDPGQWVGKSSHLFLTGGKTRLAVATVGSKEVPVLGPEVEAIGEIVFSPTGDHVAYVAGGFVHCGDRKAGPFEALGRLRWVDDDTVAFGTREGREFWWRHLDAAD